MTPEEIKENLRNHRYAAPTGALREVLSEPPNYTSWFRLAKSYRDGGPIYVWPALPNENERYPEHLRDDTQYFIAVDERDDTKGGFRMYCPLSLTRLVSLPTLRDPLNTRRRRIHL